METISGEHDKALHHALKDLKKIKRFFYETKIGKFNSHAEEPKLNLYFQLFNSRIHV